MATIEDVAQEANVSIATVSRVINNIGVVKKETADRVSHAIKKLSYTPNLAARNLRRNESRIILMLAPNFTNPYYSQILSGILDTSRHLGYITLVCNTYEANGIRENTLVDLIDANKVDGTIMLACNHDDEWLNKYSDTYPIVHCSEHIENALLPHISIDNYAAAYDMVQYLISLGHKRIGFMGSENRFLSTKDRYRGYCQALHDAGLPVRREYIAAGSVEYSFQSGKSACEAMLKLKERPTAIFCISDVLALGVIAQAQESGLRVPEDLSVSGFDDVDYTTMFHPWLTTVSIPCYEQGKRAMFLLQERMHKKTDMETGVYLPHELIIRESCTEYQA